jgi:hypothetical protein
LMLDRLGTRKVVILPGWQDASRPCHFVHKSREHSAPVMEGSG